MPARFPKPSEISAALAALGVYAEPPSDLIAAAEDAMRTHGNGYTR